MSYLKLIAAAFHGFGRYQTLTCLVATTYLDFPHGRFDQCGGHTPQCHWAGQSWWHDAHWGCPVLGQPPDWQTQAALHWCRSTNEASFNVTSLTPPPPPPLFFLGAYKLANRRSEHHWPVSCPSYSINTSTKPLFYKYNNIFTHCILIFGKRKNHDTLNTGKTHVIQSGETESNINYPKKRHVHSTQQYSHTANSVNLAYLQQWPQGWGALLPWKHAGHLHAPVGSDHHECW